eukprot:6020205-Amphidinium_carterae.1
MAWTSTSTTTTTQRSTLWQGVEQTTCTDSTRKTVQSFLLEVVVSFMFSHGRTVLSGNTSNSCFNPRGNSAIFKNAHTSKQHAMKVVLSDCVVVTLPNGWL